MSEGVWGRPESPHSQPMIYQSIKNNVVYYIYGAERKREHGCSVDAACKIIIIVIYKTKNV